MKYVDETRRVVSYYASDIDSPPEIFSSASTQNRSTSDTSPDNRPHSAPQIGDSHQRSPVHPNLFDQQYANSDFLHHSQPSQGLSISQIIHADLEKPPPLQPDDVSLQQYHLPAISELLTEGNHQSSGNATIHPTQQFTQSPRSLVPQERPVWPLTDPTEANLLRHYIQHLAIWVWLHEHNHIYMKY